MAGIFGYLYSEFSRDVQDTIEQPTVAKMTYGELMREFAEGNKDILEGYIEQAIEVSGTLHQVSERNGVKTILLQDKEFEVMVICEMQSRQILPVENLKPGNKIRLKGIYKGVLKDIILLNCILLDNDLDL